MKEQDCGRAIIVAHNATFDHGFVMAAAERAGLKRNPFHPFATFDTAALSGLALGQTVLAKACQSARIPFDNKGALRPLRHRAHHRAVLSYRQPLEEPGWLAPAHPDEVADDASE